MDDLESIDRKKDKKRMKSVEAKISKRTGQSKKKTETEVLCVRRGEEEEGGGGGRRRRRKRRRRRRKREEE